MKVDFEAHYRNHYRRVFGLCRRLLGRPVQAEDAAQEVFVRAYRSIDTYDSAEPFAPWVLSIASRHCIDLLRRRSREAKLFQNVDADAAAMESTREPAVDAVANALADAERSAEVRAAIAALPDRYRVPLVLAYYNESSYDDIAASLGITRNHVGVLLLRAKQLLRRALGNTQERST